MHKLVSSDRTVPQELSGSVGSKLLDEDIDSRKHDKWYLYVMSKNTQLIFWAFCEGHVAILEVFRLAHSMSSRLSDSTSTQ